MSRGKGLSRLGSATSLTAVLLATGLTGAQPLADPGAEACGQALYAAKALEQEGKLLAADAELSKCAQPTCPTEVAGKCISLLEEVKGATPTLIIVAKDSSGADLIDVRVLVDDVLRFEALDGRPLALDPGVHALRFEVAGAEPIRQRIVARQAERNRRIEVQFPAPAAAAQVPNPGPPATVPPAAPPPADPAADEEGGLSPLVYTGFAVGGVGLVLGTVLGLISLSNASDLEEECDTSGCTQDDIDSSMALAHVSTAGFVIAGVGSVLGVVGLFLSGSEGEADAGGVTITPQIGLGAMAVEVTF
ncbi:MAG: hypothetical protein JRI68_14515 [Deltaproteobacteria bacterium]|nr:hypothetical protein [Deltaproteobacteria bacterium]